MKKSVFGPFRKKKISKWPFLTQKWPKKAPKHRKKLKIQKKRTGTFVADMFLDRLEKVAGLESFRDFQGFDIFEKKLRVFPKKLPKKRFRPVLKGKNIFLYFKLNKKNIKKIFFRLKIFEKKIKICLILG